MHGNVLSWNVALTQGFEPRLYSYIDIPLGEYAAILDFKIWAKKIMGINCYFTHSVTGQKFQLTVYCRHRSGTYEIDGCRIDFANCPTEKLYRLGVIADQKKRILFKSAMLL